MGEGHGNGASNLALVCIKGVMIIRMFLSWTWKKVAPATLYTLKSDTGSTLYGRMSMFCGESKETVGHQGGNVWQVQPTKIQGKNMLCGHETNVPLVDEISKVENKDKRPFQC